MDARKAFDSVDHEYLLKVLEAYLVNVPPDSAYLKICNAQIHDWAAKLSLQEICRAVTNKMPKGQGM